jgi:hypothetical protein
LRQQLQLRILKGGLERHGPQSEQKILFGRIHRRRHRPAACPPRAKAIAARVLVKARLGVKKVRAKTAAGPRNSEGIGAYG